MTAEVARLAEWVCQYRELLRRALQALYDGQRRETALMRQVDALRAEIKRYTASQTGRR